jgi:phytoene/squalene synthetase
MKNREIFIHLNDKAFSSSAYQRSDSKLWVFCIKLFKHLSPKRGGLILGINTIMRNLDDIADGDQEPPRGFTRTSYLQRKRDFSMNPNNPEDDIEKYILHCTRLAHVLGFDIGEELNDFFTYFMFDAERLGTGRVFPRADLDNAYGACARATINGVIKVFGGTPDNFDTLSIMGKAVRIHYTLRDFDIDMAKGLVNIPLEKIKQYHIDPKDLSDQHSLGVKKWFHNQAALGMNLLKQYHEEVKKGTVPLLTQVIFPLMYERSARANFEAVLADNK